MESVLTRQCLIAELAEKKPQECFTSLNHYLDMAWMKEAYERLRRDSAVGVDGQSVEDYGKELESNLESLINRAKSGSYVAPPVRRIHIPKGDGKQTRPIGIPTTEDKVLQKAIVMLMEPIYEQDFLECSYGFRRWRSAHDALGALWKQCMDNRVEWIIDVDIRSFFDTLNHGKLREILDRRVRDGVVRRMIGKWLNAGVMEERTLSYRQDGTPQGGIISPLLSNIFLHEVLDTWFMHTVKARLKGRAFLVRYADDLVMGFECEEDARKVYQVLPKRLERYGLCLHSEKTQLIPFACPREGACVKGKQTEPGTFDFLGFTHYWGKSQRGRYVVKRKTAAKRIRRSLKAINQWLRVQRHQKIKEQWKGLKQKLHGHYAYYGMTGNGQCLKQFLTEVTRLWHKWLNRRDRARNSMSWERFKLLLERYPLPPVRVVHSIYA